MAKGFTDQGVFAHDNLCAGDLPVESIKVTIALSAALTRGAVLGKITADGKYLLSAAGAIDGSEVPDAILAEDVDASAADAEAMVYRAGEFNEAALSFGVAHTAATVREGLRQRGIFLKKITEA